MGRQGCKIRLASHATSTARKQPGLAYSRPTPVIHFIHQDSLSPKLYNLPKQPHHLGTKCSNTWIWGRCFITSHNTLILYTSTSKGCLLSQGCDPVLFSGSQGRSISSTGFPLNMMSCLYLWGDRDWEKKVPLYYWLSCWRNHCLTKYRSLWGLSWKQDLSIVFHQGHPACFLEESSSLPIPCVGICLLSLDRHIFPDLFR